MSLSHLPSLQYNSTLRLQYEYNGTYCNAWKLFILTGGLRASEKVLFCSSSK